MAGWTASKNTKKLNNSLEDENEDLMGTFLSRKSSFDLLQNCDLPPPLKVYSGTDKAVRSSSRVFSNDFDIYGNDQTQSGENDKLEILRALRLSQTRAREAEKRIVDLVKENEFICNGFLKESMSLFAYRQWVRLLEVQVIKLQSEMEFQEKKSCCNCGKKEGNKLNGGDDGGISWILALALCLGIAGVGFVFRCKYWF